MLYRVIKDYRSTPNPIVLKAGERVVILEDSDPGGDWPNWRLCRCASQEGWVPRQIIREEGKAGSFRRGVVTEDYNAREFDLRTGEILRAERELNGWIWCTKDDAPEEKGWAPLNCLKIIE